MAKTFVNESNVCRRKPDKYMRNPTKVYFTTLGPQTYGYYEVPGMPQPIISINKMKDRSPSEYKKFIPEVPTFKTVSPTPKLPLLSHSSTKWKQIEAAPSLRHKFAKYDEYLECHTEKFVNQTPKSFKADYLGREKATQVVDQMLRHKKARAYTALKKQYLAKRASISEFVEHVADKKQSLASIRESQGMIEPEDDDAISDDGLRA